MKIVSKRRALRAAKVSSSVNNVVQHLEQRILFAFTAGDIAVERIGDGSTTTLSSAASPVFVDEFLPSGASQTPAYSVALPTTGSNPLTDAGSSSGEGYLTLSADGRYLVLPGYDATTGTATVASAANISREIGRVDSSGNTNTSTTFSNAYKLNAIRSVVSIDGNEFWTAGAATAANGPGVQYIALGGTSATQISDTSGPATLRAIELFNGQMYVSAMTSVGPLYGAGTVGSGYNFTSGPQSITELNGFPTATSTSESAYQFAFANPTTLYVADDNASSGGVEKWTLKSGTWTEQYSALYASSTGNVGFRGLTIDNTTGTLYATTAEASLNHLVALTDTGSGFTQVTLAVSPANEIFRGVALAPQATTPLPYVSSQPSNVTASAGNTVTFTAASYGTPVPTVQWYQSTNGGTSYQPISGATSTTLTLTNVSGSQNAYEYEAKFTNSSGTTTSQPATLTITSGALFSVDASSYSVNENAGTVTIKVDRTGSTSGTVTVDYATANGTASSPTNYTATSGTLSFGPGVTSENIVVPISAVYPQNGNKTFTVSLTNPQGGGASLAPQSTATVTIVDVGEIFSFSTATYSVNEDAGQVQISVVRSDNLSDAGATVAYSTSAGTAAAGANYTTTSGILTFAANQTVALITVPIVAATQTQNLTFNVSLSAPTAGNAANYAAVLGTPSSTTVTIVNSAALAGTLKGDAAYDDSIETSGPYPSGWSLIVGDNTTTNPTQSQLSFYEYTMLEFSKSGSPSMYPAAGYTVSSLSNLSLLMYTPTDASYHALISGNFNMYFIADSDTTTPDSHLTYNANVPTGLDPAQFQTAPQYMGTFSFTGGQGTATEVTYTAGSLSSTISQEIVADLNAGTSFRVAVTPVATGVGAIATRLEGIYQNNGTDYSPILSLTVNQAQTSSPETLALSNTSYSVSESAGTATITLTRTGNTSDVATVQYSLIDGTALEGTNYGTQGTTTPQITGTVTFPKNATSASFTVPVINVPNQNGDKALTITLSNPTSDSSGGTTTVAGLGQSSAVLTIKDTNDANVSLETLGNFASNIADVETSGVFSQSFKISGVSASFPSYAVADFNDGTVTGPYGPDTITPSKTVTAINDINLTIFNTSGGASGLVDIYMVPNTSVSIAVGANPPAFDTGQYPEGLDTSGSNSFGTPMLLGQIYWSASSAADTYITYQLMNYTPATANALISALNSGSVFRIVGTPESSYVATNWGSFAGIYNGNPTDPQISIDVQEGTVSTAPSWIDPSTPTGNYSYNGTNSLTVHGAVKIIGDPGSGVSITTDGGASSVITINPTSVKIIHLASLSLTGGASAVLTSVGAGRAAGAQRVLVMGGLSVDSSSKLDLQDNDAVILGGSISTLSTDVKTGFASGHWTGAGIISSSAAGDTRHLTTLGIASGSVTNGAQFDGVNVGSSDVLIKYTYMGDANLDGSVNGADYQQIDSGYGTAGTTWSQGDFNYDTHVDGSDFSLIDNTFNQTHALGSSPLAIVASAVPVTTTKSVFSAVPISSSSSPSDDSQTKDKKTLAEEVFDS